MKAFDNNSMSFMGFSEKKTKKKELKMQVIILSKKEKIRKRGKRSEKEWEGIGTRRKKEASWRGIGDDEEKENIEYHDEDLPL